MNIQTHTPDTIEQLAGAFFATLTVWLSPAEFRRMRIKNRAHADAGRTGVCASHDFCDANEAMAEAFQRVLHRDCVLPSDGNDQQCAEDMRAWNAAWDHARAAYLTA